MLYPANAVIQTYDMNAVRVIQLPCMSNQPEPPQGFRAAIVPAATVAAGNPPNQNGPPMVIGSSPAAIDIDFTPITDMLLGNVFNLVALNLQGGGSQVCWLQTESGVTFPMTNAAGALLSAIKVFSFSASPKFSFQTQLVDNSPMSYQFIGCNFDPGALWFN